MFWIRCYRITTSAVRMTIRHEQLRMVERSSLGDCPRGPVKAFRRKSTRARFVLHREAKDLNIWIHVLDFFNCVEVAAAVVELDYLLKR